MKNEPCKECPFRRASMPGWLGDHATSQEIVNIVQFDGFFPCHMRVSRLVNLGVPFPTAAAEAEHCIGALAFMNNSCKVSRDPDIARQQQEVGRREDCFSWSFEMTEHHGR
jgi:hypothetical protein